MHLPPTGITFFPARRYASAVLDIRSLGLPLRHIITCTCSVETAEWIESTLCLSYIVSAYNFSLSAHEGTPVSCSWDFIPNSALSQCLPHHVDRRKCCQLSLTEGRRQFMAPSAHSDLSYQPAIARVRHSENREVNTS